METEAPKTPTPKTPKIGFYLVLSYAAYHTAIAVQLFYLEGFNAFTLSATVPYLGLYPVWAFWIVYKKYAKWSFLQGFLIGLTALFVILAPFLVYNTLKYKEDVRNFEKEHLKLFERGLLEGTLGSPESNMKTEELIKKYSSTSSPEATQ